MPSEREVILTLKLKRSSSTFEGKLLKYLLERFQGQAPAELIVKATSAFWMPLALRDVGGATEQQVKEMGWKAIAELEAQIMYIKRVLHLIEPGSPTTTSPVAYYPVPVQPGDRMTSRLSTESSLSQITEEIDTQPEVEEEKTEMYMTEDEIQEIESSGWNMF